MPSTYSNSLRLELIANGEQTNTWGTTTNNNLGTLLEEAIAGVKSITISGDYSLTTANATTDDARNAVLVFEGVITATTTITVPSKKKKYTIRNATSGGYDLLIKTAAGTGTTVHAGSTTNVFCDGANVYSAQVFGSGSAAAPGMRFGSFQSGFYANATGTEVNEVVSNVLVRSDNTQYSQFYTKVLTPTSGTTLAGFNLPHGTAPTTPVNGDVWTTTSGAFVQVNGTTQTFAFASNNNPVSFASGSATSPSLNFSAQTSSGLYYVATGIVGLATAGVERMRWSSSGVSYTVPMLAPAGTVSSPAYSFVSDTDTGLYQQAVNELSFTVGGVRRGYMNSVSTVIADRLQVNSESTYPMLELRAGSTFAYGMFVDPSTSIFKLVSTDGAGGGVADYLTITPSANGALKVPGVYAQTSGSSNTVNVDANGQLYRVVSARKYKRDILNYTKGLDDLLKLTPVTYAMKFAHAADDPEERHVGFIADDADALGLSEFVSRDPVSQEIEGFKYAQLTTLLVNAVKELSAEVTALKAEVTALKARS